MRAAPLLPSSELFDLADTDGSGTIDKVELQKLAADHDHVIVERLRHYAARCGFDLDSEDIFDKFDVNSDGSVTKHEFIAALKDELLCRVYYDRAGPRISTRAGGSYILKRDLFCVLDRDHVARKFLDERCPGIWFKLQSDIMKDANSPLRLVDYLALISFSAWQARGVEDALVADAESQIAEVDGRTSTAVVDQWLSALPSTVARPPPTVDADAVDASLSLAAALPSRSPASDAATAALPPSPPSNGTAELTTPEESAAQLAFGAITIEDFHAAAGDTPEEEKRALLEAAHASYVATTALPGAAKTATVALAALPATPQRSVMGGAAGLPPKYLTDSSVEAPAGERTDGAATFAVYTSEQQERLGVNENGAPVDNKAWATWATEGHKDAIASFVQVRYRSP